MATQAEVLAKTYAAGDVVERSGIYRVSHGQDHAQPYDVTVLYGTRFPACRACKQPQFNAERLAQHVESHADFEPHRVVSLESCQISARNNWFSKADCCLKTGQVESPGVVPTLGEVKWPQQLYPPTNSPSCATSSVHMRVPRIRTRARGVSSF